MLEICQAIVQTRPSYYEEEVDDDLYSRVWNNRKHCINSTAINRDSNKVSPKKAVQIKVDEGLTIHFALRDLSGVGPNDCILEVVVRERKIAQNSLPRE